MLLQRSQWFFFDEWSFLQVKGPPMLEPHVGHWSTSPMALFHVLRDTVGMDSYLPFAFTETVAHVAVAHLIWRISLKGGANPWIATEGLSLQRNSRRRTIPAAGSFAADGGRIF